MNGMGPQAAPQRGKLFNEIQSIASAAWAGQLMDWIGGGGWGAAHN